MISYRFFLKLMINAMILVLTLLTSLLWVATFHVPRLMVFTFLNSFGLQEYCHLADFNARSKTRKLVLLFLNINRKMVAVAEDN